MNPNYTQREKIISYLTLRRYDTKWGEIYRDMREEMKSIGVTDPTRVTQITPRLIHLKGKMNTIHEKLRNELKLFNVDGIEEANELIIDLFKDTADKIDKEVPLG